MTDLKSNKKRKGHPQVINPVGEFCLPITLPDDPEWVAAFINAVRKLSNRSTWDYDATGDYIVLADRWKEIADTIQLAYQGGLDCADVSQPDEGTCTTLSAHHPAVSYWPNNPVLQPDEPGPYSSRVWRVGNPINPFEQSGDSYIDPLSFLGIPLSEVFTIGLPYWRVAFEGSGEVDIGLVQVLQGGAMWVFPDDNPLAGDLVSLQYIDIEELAGVEALLSLLEIIGQSDFQIVETVHTVEFTTPGEHSLTGWMIPTVEPAPPFLGIGGGLRSIQLCGDITVIEDAVIPYTLDAQPDGTIRLLADGVPISTLDLKALLDDDYVNVEGDTMTGTLEHKLDGIQHRFRTQANAIQGDIRIATGVWEFARAAAAIMLWTGTTNAIRLIATNSYYAIYHPSAGTGPADGTMRVVNTDASQSALALQNKSSGPLWSGYDNQTRKVALIAQNGGIRGLSLEGYDYSSTVWRKQFGMAGFWSESTDAVRTGGFSLAVSDYGGDVEIMRADYGPYPNLNPLLSFFDGVGSRPVPIAAVDGLDLASKLALKLQAYGLIESYTVDQPAEVATTLTDQEKCNVAYYVATALANLIAATFDDMTNVTADEVVSNIVDSFDGIGSVPANVVYEAFQAAYAERVGIAADLTDPSILADLLIAADYDLTAFLAAIELYAWAWGGTPEFLVTTITEAWSTVVPSWIAEGRTVDSVACAGEDWSCAGGSLDYRWGQLHGTQLFIGLVGGQGIGLSAEEFNTDQWAINVRINLDGGCTMEEIEVDYFGAGSTLRAWVTLGDEMQLDGPYFPAGGTQAGYQTGVFHLAGQGLDDARQIQVEFTTQGNVFASTINQVRWGSEV